MSVLASDLRQATPWIRFTEHDALRAAMTWRFNCGPAAFAALLGLTPDEARAYWPDFPGFTNPTRMADAFVKAGIRRTGWYADAMPSFGVARIQFEGPWLSPGVPAKVAYRFTHWVASVADGPHRFIFDVNNLGVPSVIADGWLPRERWEAEVIPALLASVKRATGWHVTHAFEVSVEQAARPIGAVAKAGGV